MKKVLITIALSFWFGVHIFGQAPKISFYALKCNFQTNPLGVESPNPSLSWSLKSIDKSVIQTGYQIQVASTHANLNSGKSDFWDTGKIISDKSIQVEYQGKPLESNKKYYWRVIVWTNNFPQGIQSPTQTLQMGLLQESDWSNSKWIALEQIKESDKVLPALHYEKPPQVPFAKMPILRKQVDIPKTIINATAYVCGLGHFEFSINGKKVGTNFLDPGWTLYYKTAQYVSFDVTKSLLKGQNTLGIELGNGFYNIPRGRYHKILQSFGYPAAKAIIKITYSDNTTSEIVTDKSWKTVEGPTRFSSIYGSEDFDATLDFKGWKNNGFNDSQWQSAVELNTKMPRLISQTQEPLGYFDEFKPKKITKINDSTYVYDLGQNFSGIPKITALGTKAQKLTLRPAELIHDNGTVNQNAVGRPVYMNYTLGSNTAETWQPKFMYYGFRYVQIENAVPSGYPNPKKLPIVKALSGIHTRNKAETVGKFTCSNPLFNQIFDLINWSIKSNMASVLTDCPHREKLGWLEEAYLMGNSLRYNFDLATLYPKIVQDIKDSQLENGMIPDIAPEYVYFGGGFRDSPEWGSAGIIIPYEMYQWYGDKAVLKNNYEVMKKYLDYLTSKSTNHIVSHGLGDWFDYGPKAPGEAQLTSKELSATATYIYDIQIMAKTAALLDYKEDAIKFQELEKVVTTAFNEKFYDKTSKIYEKGSQTAFAMPIVLGIVPKEDKEAVAQNLVKSIQNDNHKLTAGDVGFHYLVAALQMSGASETLYKMNSRNDVPGYGFQLAKGATALTESWPALREVSNNHFMLGHLMEWFYTGIGGIKMQEGTLAFQKIIIKPEMVGDLTSADVSFESMYGAIRSAWKKDNNKTTMYIEIPVNTSAEVFLPSGNVRIVGQPLDSKALNTLNNSINLGSGKYTIEISK
ncbi:MAG: family 78 glycoside hydrolase catalytic domain [Leadbetterella sp.]